MNAGQRQHPTPADTACNAAGEAEGDPLRRETRNTLVMETYQVVLRVGWIFKTETIIMPAVLDAVADSGLLRGLLPVLNRGGQSIPPLLAAGRLARLPVKKWTLIRTTLLMAVWFGLLALAWVPLQSWRPHLLAGLFLVLYALFSASNGLNQLTVASLQGKLISPGHRGRAMVVSVVVGSVVAILAAILFLGPWLAESDGFPKIFGMTAAFFGVAAGIPILFDEPADPLHQARQPGVAGDRDPQSGSSVCQATWRATLLADRSLVRLCLVAGCFSAVLMLFPHYQAFARDRLGSQIGSLLTWVVAQNVATGVASLVAGPVADRSGTRIVLIWLVALSSLTPAIVILLSMMPPGTAVDLFWLVYLPLGLNPISLKIFTNYALELAPRAAEHPRYVSIVGAALAAPFILSPLVGMAVDGIGFTPVFVAGAAVIMAGAAVATGLPEPRSDSTGSHRARGLPHKAAWREPAG
jgi:hypothetical protein